MVMQEIKKRRRKPSMISLTDFSEILIPMGYSEHVLYLELICWIGASGDLKVCGVCVFAGWLESVAPTST